jgi:hypothetical protein
MSNWRQTIDAPLPPQNSELELRNLLRHLPELAEDVELAGWGCSYAVRSPFLRINFTTDDPPRVSLSTNLRHDHDPAIKALIQRAFAHRLHEYTLGPDTLDVYHASVAERDGWPTLPIMRADIFGEPYWDLAPRRVRL